MNRFAISLAAAAALLSAPVVAADLIVDVPEPGVVVDDSGFDWDGAFAGVYGAALFGSPITASWGLGGFIGANMTHEQFLLGGIVSAGGFTQGSMDGEWIVQGIGRVGVLATDNIALYGLAGVGYETYNDGLYLPVGAGAEVGFADDLSVRLQYQADYVVDQNIWVSSISTGIAFHF